MPKGFLFWVLMILWLVLGLYVHRSAFETGSYGILGGDLLEFILMGLLGWKVFGPAVQ